MGTFSSLGWLRGLSGYLLSAGLTAFRDELGLLCLLVAVGFLRQFGRSERGFGFEVGAGEREEFAAGRRLPPGEDVAT